MTASDEALLAAARSGEPGALDALIERHQARVFRFGLKMCRDREDASDVLQDTLLALARGVRDFRGESSLSTWLFTVARSFCIKKRRRRKHEPAELVSLEGGGAAPQDAPGAGRRDLPDPGRDPEATLAGKRVEQALERAIAGLDPAYREVLLLRDVEGLSAAEVATVMGLNVGAVKTRLHRARLAVRQQLEPLLGVPAPARAPGNGAATAPPQRPAGGRCPDVLALFSRHLEGDISAATCAEMEAHLQDCAHCRQACDSLKATLALCRANPPGPVPAEVQEAVRRALAT